MRTEMPPDDKFRRALQMRRLLDFKEQTGDIIPYLQKQALVAAGVGRGPIKMVGAPKVSTSFVKGFRTSDYKDQKFVHECKHTMINLGKMDGYAFGANIPKFDPWVRDILKEECPDLEASLVEKFLRDPSTPERVMRHFARFDQVWMRKPQNARMKRANRILRNMFRCMNNSISPIDFNFDGWRRIVHQLEMASSPGLPLRREYSTQSDCLPYIYDKAKRLNHFAKFLPPHAVEAPPCMIGLRPGLTEYDKLEDKVKARGVWAYPAEVKVIEMRYTMPILDRLSTLFGDVPYITGVNLNKGLPMVIDHLLSPGKSGMVFDISHLDDSIGPDYIAWAFDVMKGWMDWGFTKSSIKRNQCVFDFIKYYFMRTPILLPSGQLVKKYGGVPSGSGFTQIVDTLVTLLINIYALLENGVPESDILMFAVGDDVAMSVPHNYSVTKHARSLNRLGFEVNTSKVMFSSRGEDLIFLGYSRHGGHVRRELVELLKTAMFPERYVGSAGRSCDRLLGQHIASGCCDPRFGTLVQRAFERRLFRPLEIEDQYEPQARWVRKVLHNDTLPRTPHPLSLLYLT